MPCITISSSLGGGCLLEQNFDEDACILDVKVRVKIKHGHPVAVQVLMVPHEVVSKALEDTQKLTDLTPPIQLTLIVDYTRCSIPDEVLSWFRIAAADPSRLPMEAIRKLLRTAAEYDRKEEACQARDCLEEGNTPLLVAVQAKEAGTRSALFEALWDATAAVRGGGEVAVEHWRERTKSLRRAVLTDSNDSEWTALHFAAEAGDHRLCKKLLQRGRESGLSAVELLNAVTWSEPPQTPFQVALARRHLHAAALLYAWTDQGDRMPVEDVRSVLERMGMELRHRKLGEALHEAVDSGSEDVVGVLLEVFALAPQDMAAMLLWPGPGPGSSETALLRAREGNHPGIERALSEAAVASGVPLPPGAGIPSDGDLHSIANGGAARAERLHAGELR